MGWIRRTFVSLDVEIKKKKLSLVRLRLEYANQVWTPYLIKDMDAVENVHRRTSKLVPALKNLNYEEQLKKLGLPTLAYRRAKEM